MDLCGVAQGQVLLPFGSETNFYAFGLLLCAVLMPSGSVTEGKSLPKLAQMNLMEHDLQICASTTWLAINRRF